ncbi:LytTR family transcriptional regulator [Rheinheimera muenzenbergensis]|uniref:LytTR family transcriptional regulator n=1 Tax=Rheinheimera muenzenbergensis TaxID=1193628 RepID=A0ABU8C632_9GAMM
MLINNTVLGKAPFRATLVVVSLFLTILFTLMQPAVSYGLAFFPRLLFWLLQVATGMLGIVVASLLLRQLASRNLHLLLLLAITGVVGAMLAAPVFVLIDQWFPGLQSTADSWVDEFSMQGPWQAVVAECLEVLPILLVSWYVVNLPLILNATYINLPLPDEPDSSADQTLRKQRQYKEQFFAKLPAIIGHDIVSISSDLHYLNVTTTLGSSLILGSLSQFADVFEDEGFLVHRSHWVHKNHVVRVHIAGNQAFCILSNHAHIPVSRSKRKLVKAYFGQSRQAAAGSAAPHLRRVD